MAVRTRIDPHITSTSDDDRVDPGEMASRHDKAGETSGEGMTLGVMDTGVVHTHDRVSGPIREYNQVVPQGIDSPEADSIGHGTLVADFCVRHIPGVKLVSFKVFGESGKARAEDIYEALNVAVSYAENNDLDVLNMSFGSMRVDSKMQNYVNELARAGCVPVAAAGNTGGSTGSPADAKYAIAVGALQEKGKRMTNFSSWDQDDDPDPGFGGIPDVSAIGKNVVGARANGTSVGEPISETLTKASGTSFAAPFVSGAIIDLRRRRPDLSPKEIVWLVEQSANDIPGTVRDGLGRFDWTGAVNLDELELPWMVPGTVYSLPYVGGRLLRVEDTIEPESGEYEVDMGKLLSALEKQ